MSPHRRAIDVVDLVREIKSRPLTQLPGDVATLEIEVAEAADTIDQLREELVEKNERLRESLYLVMRMELAK